MGKKLVIATGLRVKTRVVLQESRPNGKWSRVLVYCFACKEAKIIPKKAIVSDRRGCRCQYSQSDRKRFTDADPSRSRPKRTRQWGRGYDRSTEASRRGSTF